MFGFLKKKIEESIKKITKKVEKKEVPKEIIKKPRKKEEIKKVETETKKSKKKIISFGSKEIKEEDLKDLLWELQVSLLESDVALETAEKICNDLKKNLIGKRVKKKELENLIKESMKKSLEEIFDLNYFDLIEKIKKKKPYTILFLGFNGSGKTTSIARLAFLLKNKGLSVNFAAADTWRAAAIHQLEKHAKNLNVPIVKHDYGADAAAVVFDAIKNAKAKNIDVVLADTAGRTHTNTNLMEELKKICKVNNPDLKILVVDSLTGNDAVEQARAFENIVGIDAIILTKIDVNEKGGAALSVAHTIKKPILYIGVGQEYKDLKKFDPQKIIKNLLG